MRIEPRSLVRRLTPSATRALEAAVGRAAGGEYREVVPEHLLLALLEPDDGEVAIFCKKVSVDREGLLVQVERALGALPTGSSARPVFSRALFDWIQDAWLLASVEHGQQQLRTATLLSVFAAEMGRYTAEIYPELSRLPHDELRTQVDSLVAASSEAGELASAIGAPAGGAGQAGNEALERFTTNFTEKARKAELDPVLGRHREIRQMVDVLSRRRKNNPIIVGEPGVGKTALVEGLALAVAAGEVPDTLKNVEIRGLDMGALQAGAGVRGEFENRLKGVINEIKSSATPIILFVDEAHTLIGSGGQQGTSDAANLLKPELARGELRTIAATTWSEYKKYFEKDAALERRFQPIKVDPPSVEDAVVILRGLRERYEASHGIAIRDDALVAAAELSARYIAGRHLPDKAIDLLDSAAARARVDLNAKPERVAALEAHIAALQRQCTGLERDQELGVQIDTEGLSQAEAEVEARKDELASLKTRWEEERQQALEMVAQRRKLLDPKEDRESVLAALYETTHKLDALRGADPALVHGEADAQSVARVVEAWTGVPVSNMSEDQVRAVVNLEDTLQQRVKGQDHAMRTVAETVRMSSAGVRDPETPVGVLLFVGPSGVGKTETALALADALYGGERFMTPINMSEFQEKHSVSRLVGSPPGYVGYGEGGVLTEAVRQRPYSVVLLDECEKADLEVMNLFYQVFDKGTLSDGEGREVDFRNTLVILTSNLATAEIDALYAAEEPPTVETVTEAIRPVLSRHFKPALLARMTVVPYAPIAASILEEIAALKLARLGDRLAAAHGAEVVFADDLIKSLADRCTQGEAGARSLDHVLRGSLMPTIAQQLLQELASGQEISRVHVGLDDAGSWKVDVNRA